LPVHFDLLRQALGQRAATTASDTEKVRLFNKPLVFISVKKKINPVV